MASTLCVTSCSLRSWRQSACQHRISRSTLRGRTDDTGSGISLKTQSAASQRRRRRRRKRRRKRRRRAKERNSSSVLAAHLPPPFSPLS
eukprot:3676068-Rhodomonas_salina.1